MPIDKSQYRESMALVGGEYSGYFFKRAPLPPDLQYFSQAAGVGRPTRRYSFRADAIAPLPDLGDL